VGRPSGTPIDQGRCGSATRADRRSNADNFMIIVITSLGFGPDRNGFAAGATGPGDAL
jgi:hypothetical protein